MRCSTLVARLIAGAFMLLPWGDSASAQQNSPAALPPAAATPRPAVQSASPPALAPAASVVQRAGEAVHDALAPGIAVMPADADLINNARSTLVFVEGHEAAGSGFLCDLGGQKFLVTNAHVLAGNTQINFTLLDGSLVRVGAAASAVGHDMVRLAVAPESAAFALLDHLDQNLRVGDDVLVLGNAEGARVINPISGRVVGVGPNLIEVDAPFLPGNSGSPIIQKRTGKIVGIATYVRVEEGGKVPTEKRTRRFGYRIDSVKAWQPISWPLFQAEAAEIKKVDQLTDDLAAFAEDTSKHKGQISVGVSQNPAIERPVETFVDTMRGRPSPTDALEAKRRLLDSLRRACQSDIAALRPRLRYDYFQREAEDRQRIRDSFSQGFDAWMKSQVNTTNR